MNKGAWRLQSIASQSQKGLKRLSMHAHTVVKCWCYHDDDMLLLLVLALGETRSSYIQNRIFKQCMLSKINNLRYFHFVYIELDVPFKRKYQIGNCFLRYAWTVDINLSSIGLVNEKANENFITKKQNNKNEKITGEGYQQNWDHRTRIKSNSVAIFDPFKIIFNKWYDWNNWTSAKQKKLAAT